MSDFSCLFGLGSNPEGTGHAVLILSVSVTYIQPFTNAKGMYHVVRHVFPKQGSTAADSNEL